MRYLMMRVADLKANEKGGFTLMELVVAIGIMAILALIMMPNLTAYLDKARDAKILANMKNVHTSAELADKVENNLIKEQVSKFSNIDKLIVKEDSEPVLRTYTVHKSSKGKITIKYLDTKGKIHYFPNKDGNGGVIVPNPVDPADPVDPVDPGNSEADQDDGVDYSLMFLWSEVPGGVSIDGITKAGLEHYGDDLVIPKRIEGKQVVKIKKYMLADYGFRTLQLPDGLLEIGKEAFGGNKIRKVIIPESVVFIDEYAFYMNNISELQLPQGLKTIKKGAFGINSLTSLHIPEGVEIIEDFAFSSNLLTEVSIPRSVSFLGIGLGIREAEGWKSITDALDYETWDGQWTLPNGAKNTNWIKR